MKLMRIPLVLAALAATAVAADTPEAGWKSLYNGKDLEGWVQRGRKAFKADEWNKFRIECRGSSIKTWLNGVPAADLEDSATPKGFIGLQVHGVGKRKERLEVRFRKLRIKELKD